MRVDDNGDRNENIPVCTMRISGHRPESYGPGRRRGWRRRRHRGGNIYRALAINMRRPAPIKLCKHQSRQKLGQKRQRAKRAKCGMPISAIIGHFREI